MLERVVETQFGMLVLCEEADAITGLRWGRTGADDNSHLLDEAVRQLRAYDRGDREHFDLPLDVRGSAFQRAVCDAIRAIPFGETRTYGEIARVVNAPAQAVGQACGANPIPIIIPCHRVMGARGLTGFSSAGGVETKLALLKHEKAGSFLI
jgi:methylated-DNA-[protein]-cysteine S-methyltransferase